LVNSVTVGRTGGRSLGASDDVLDQLDPWAVRLGAGRPQRVRMRDVYRRPDHPATSIARERSQAL
jgi:hypothetical protein